MTDRPDYTLDPRFIAGVKLLERSGAREFRIGWSDPDDGDPTVWYAYARWQVDLQTGRPVARWGRAYHEAMAAIDPVEAVMRLCEKMVDGGICTHCDRMTVFSPNVDPQLEEITAVAAGCLYGWDPELETFRRGCEGDT